MLYVSVATLGLVAGLGALWLWLFQRTSQISAIEEAGRSGVEVGRAALDPFVTDQFVEGGRDAFDLMAAAGSRLVQDHGAVQVQIWSDNGTTLWSSQPESIGRTVVLEDHKSDLLRTRSELVELHHEPAMGQVSTAEGRLQVNFASATQSGVPVLVQVDYPADMVNTSAARERRSFLPVYLLSAVLVVAVQVPLFVAVSRYRRAAQVQRQALMDRFVAVSDTERRWVAAEVHDVALQDLVGVALGLTVVAEEVESVPVKHELRSMADATRRTVRNLRSLLAAIYPVELPPDGWALGLEPLVETLRRRGVAVHVDIADIELPQASQLLVLRVGCEALRNISAHAHASRVDITLRREPQRISFEITDDGIGFDQNTASRQRAAGHLGLRILHHLSDELGASLCISSAPGTGTTVRLELGDGE